MFNLSFLLISFLSLNHRKTRVQSKYFMFFNKLMEKSEHDQILGIDGAKNIHEACILTGSGEQIGNFIRIKNSKSSIERFRESVESAARELNLTPRIGMEATGYTGTQYIVNLQCMKSTFTIYLKSGVSAVTIVPI
jgi:hypothetical protein